MTESPNVDAWNAWRPDWAIDLHHGRQTREHGDLEIAIPRSDFGALKPFLREYQNFAAGNGSIDPLTPDGEADFALTLPTLDSAARSWLIASLELAHPDHPWIRRCREAS